MENKEAIEKLRKVHPSRATTQELIDLCIQSLLRDSKRKELLADARSQLDRINPNTPMGTYLRKIIDGLEINLDDFTD